MKSRLLPILFLTIVSSPSWAASERGMTINQMLQIQLAIWSYHDVNSCFPTDILDANSKPLLSWRVRLLPYLEQENIYKKFRLDEPWDSPHNLPLAKETPSNYYHCKYDKSQQGLAFFAIPCGPGTWLGNKSSVNYQQLNFDKSKTILVVELAEDQGIPWTKPGDWSPNPDNLFLGLPSNRRYSPLLEPGCFVVCADGKLRFLSPSVPRETILGMLGPCEGDFPLGPSWNELFSEFPRPGGPLLALPMAFLLGAWGCFVLLRLVRRWAITPGEWLSLVVAAQQVVFLINFLWLFEFEWVPSALHRDEQAWAFCRMPWLAGFVICLFAKAACGRKYPWKLFFLFLSIALGLIALDGGGGHQYGTPEQSLFIASPPFTTGAAALLGVIITCTRIRVSSSEGHSWAHWLGLVLALVPMIWFYFWSAMGDAQTYPLFVRVRA